MILSKHLSFWGYAGLWSFYNPTLSYNNFYAARFRARDEIMSRAPLFSSYNNPHWCPKGFYSDLYSLGAWLKSTGTYLNTNTFLDSARVVARDLIMSRALQYCALFEVISATLVNNLLNLFQQRFRITVSNFMQIAQKMKKLQPFFAVLRKSQLNIVSAIELHTTSELSELITEARINIL